MNKGIYFALLTALISGVSVFLNKFVAAQFKDAYIFTTLKNILVAAALVGVLMIPKIFRELKNLNKKDWLLLILIGLIGGSIPFLLFFKGLTLTSAVSAAFIQKTLFIWVGILAVFFLKEKFGRVQWIAFALLLAGNLFLGRLRSWKIGTGELMILGATLLWSIEYIFAKRALVRLSSEVVAWGRMFFGAIFLIGFIAITGRTEQLVPTANQIGWLLISSVLLLGYVLTWYKALKYERASVVTALLVPASLITTALNGIFVTQKFSVESLAVGVLFIAAMALIWRTRPQNIYETAAQKI